MYRYHSVILTITLLCFAKLASAAGFILYELGTPIMGTAASGQAAVANDASTSYFNPAGMSQLDKTQMMVGSQILDSKVNFQADVNNTISGTNGGNAGALTPGVGIFYVHNYSPEWRFGISVTSPYAGLLNYSDGWVGRYSVQDVLLFALSITPVASYKVNDWFSVGGGVSLNYGLLDETIATSIGPFPDGQIEVDRLSDVAPQFHLGVLFTPDKFTKIGISYKSQVNFNLTGTTRFFRLAATPSVKTKLKVPHTLTVSFYRDITEKAAIVGDFGWQNWSAFDNTVIEITGLPSAVIPRNWKDTWRFGIGFHYQFKPAIMLRTGVSYDSSPATSTTRLPDLPMDSQIRFGAGAEYKANEIVTIASSFEYADLGKARIKNVNATTGTLSGDYSRNRFFALQIGANFTI